MDKKDHQFLMWTSWINQFNWIKFMNIQDYNLSKTLIIINEKLFFLITIISKFFVSWKI